MNKGFIALLLSISLSCVSSIFPAVVSANNLSITNVSFEDRTPSSNTVIVEFDISWENSWKTKINHDAIWLTVRLNDPSVTPTNKKLCQITAVGTNPANSSTGSNANLEIYVSSDQLGAFIRPTTYGTTSTVTSTDVRLPIDYSSCGFTNSDDAYASVFGLEMVFIPEGAFYAGDNDTSTASLNEGSTDSDPWYVANSSAISVANPVSDGYRYVSNGNVGEDVTGASFTIPSTFPNGYNAFYTMKYEVTEGEWIEFVNSLPSSAARSNNDITDGSHKNSDSVIARNTISCSGSPISCSTTRSFRAASFLTWMDLMAFFDWAALRPINELEFEKMTRGPLLATDGEFAWGTPVITAAATISVGSEDGTETITSLGANTHYDNTILTGGDTGSGVEYTTGPLRSGIFATSLSTRETAGAAYYGVMELSGNLRERVITIGNATGRAFLGTHGDGILSTDAGYEGNATNTDWSGIDAIPTRGITGAAGSGFKGGGWDDQLFGARLRISDRADAANASTTSFNNAGGRGARTYDGQ